MANGAVLVQEKVDRLSIDGHSGSTGDINIQGEVVQKLDELGSQIFLECFRTSESVSIVGCEELENPEIISKDPNLYMVNMDPVDGSSNIDVSISIGSIFGIWPSSNLNEITNKSLLLAGNQQIAAAYVVYGSNTILIIATQNGVSGFTLDNESKEFILTHPIISLPDNCTYYSVNYGNWDEFSSNTKSQLEELQKTSSLRYVGSLVADFHRNLIKGGVFLYPNGKLRLMYEANPLTFVMKKAGGSGTNGNENILDIIPKELHERTPLFIGNTKEVDKFTIG
ncbi:MAG: fructose-1,6-bisphosphatase [Dehalococcoidia bacterium]|nr:fructose-1,6-bisphosphatase [Dehalococcoidia bacterium]